MKPTCAPHEESIFIKSCMEGVDGAEKRKNIISSIHIWMNSDKQKDDCINIYKNCNIFMCNLWVRWQVSHDLRRDTLSFHPVPSQSQFEDPANVCFPFFVTDDNCQLCNGSILAKFSTFSMCNWQFLTCLELQNWCRCSCHLPPGADTQWFFHDWGMRVQSEVMREGGVEAQLWLQEYGGQGVSEVQGPQEWQGQRECLDGW